jgi:hypothetical protein
MRNGVLHQKINVDVMENYQNGITGVGKQVVNHGELLFIEAN